MTNHPDRAARSGVLVGAGFVAGLAAGVGRADTPCPLYLVAKPAAVLIPAGRFSGLLVSGIAGDRLARR